MGNCSKELENLFANRLPFHLISNELMESLKKRLEQEKIRIDWESKKNELEPRKKEFVDIFLNTEFVDSLNERIKSGLPECIAEAWESLYSPRHPDCAEIVLHNYLEPRERKRLEESFSKIQLGSNQILDLIYQKNITERRLKELEVSRIKSLDLENDDLLKKLNQELTEVQVELEQQNQKKGDLNRHKKALGSTIKQERSTYERENNYYILSEPAKSSAKKAQKLIGLIDELLPRLFELKIKEVSKAVSRYYKLFAHKQQINNIVIQENGNYRLFSEDNKEIKFDRSAGENEIFVTALFAGLAEVSGYKIPLVVDTPLARLDGRHRNNLLEYWRSDPDRQVILLSQDKEVDLSIRQSLEPYLSKTYLLESVLIGDGVYKTTARENSYFGESYE